MNLPCFLYFSDYQFMTLRKLLVCIWVEEQVYLLPALPQAMPSSRSAPAAACIRMLLRLYLIKNLRSLLTQGEKSEKKIRMARNLLVSA